MQWKSANLIFIFPVNLDAIVFDYIISKICHLLVTKVSGNQLSSYPQKSILGLTRVILEMQ